MKKFSGNYTLPPDGVNFVSTPNIRGTLDILWSCLSALLICTWSILHPAVPYQTNPGNKIQKYMRDASRLGAKLNWMLLNLLAPEWSLAKAWADYWSISSLEDGFKKIQAEDSVPWGRSHIHLANMGGFAIQFSSASAPAPSTTERPKVPAVKSKTDDPSNGNHFISTRLSLVGTSEDSGPAHERPPAENCLTTTQLGRSNSAPVSSLGQTSSPIIHRLRKDYSIPNTDSALEGEESIDVGATHEVDRHEALPEQAKILLRMWEPYFKSDLISALLLRRSHRFGPIPWMRDEHNFKTVHEAFDKVEMDYFHGSREKSRFGNTTPVWILNLALLQGDLWVLDAKQLLLARELGIIERLPYVSGDELADRNKADQAVKVIALLQILWFLIQTVTRLVRRLPTSQLEILTLSFVVSTAFTYALLLEKPKDVQTSIILPAARYATRQELSRLAIAGPAYFAWPRYDIWIPNNAVHAIGTSQGDDNAILGSGGAFSVLLVGLIHCVAWDFTFPTPTERVIWQASSIITAAATPTVMGVHAVASIAYSCFRTPTSNPRSPRKIFIFNTVAAFIVLIFFAARLFTTVEALRSLAFLPPGAFSTTWPDYIPHIS